jgi:hypothetical protein
MACHHEVVWRACSTAAKTITSKRCSLPLLNRQQTSTASRALAPPLQSHLPATLTDLIQVLRHPGRFQGVVLSVLPHQAAAKAYCWRACPFLIALPASASLSPSHSHSPTCIYPQPRCCCLLLLHISLHISDRRPPGRGPVFHSPFSTALLAAFRFRPLAHPPLTSLAAPATVAKRCLAIPRFAARARYRKSALIRS